MKSAHCRTRWHDRCAGIIEHDDGSANVCECDCGHAGVVQAIFTLEKENRVSPQQNCPPPHPEPFDHNLYRVAEDPPGTDMYQPWIAAFCIHCLMPLWTHSALMAEKNECLCEECSWLLISEISETRAKRQNVPVQRYHDPFVK